MLKKFLAMVYALVAVMVLVGCGDDDSQKPSETIELGDSKVEEVSKRLI